MFRRLGLCLIPCLLLAGSSPAEAGRHKQLRQTRQTKKQPPASGPLSELPRGHWAYATLRFAYEAGILQCCFASPPGYGNRLVNRYQMAVITARMLDRAGVLKANGREISGADVAKMESLAIEFAPELHLLNVKDEVVQETLRKLRRGLPMVRQQELSSFKPTFEKLLSHVRKAEVTVGEPKVALAKKKRPEMPVGAARVNGPGNPSSKPKPLILLGLVVLAVMYSSCRSLRPRALLLAPLP